MGIKNIKKLISVYGTDTTLASLTGKKVAVDTSIFLYKFVYSGDYLQRFYDQIVMFAKNDVLPIYCFDGKAPPEKGKVLQQRKEKKQLIIDKLEQMTLKGEDTTKVEKSIIRITPEHNINLKKLFDSCGVPYVCPVNTEGDKVCGRLDVDAVVTNDMDVLLFGGKVCLTNLDSKGNIIRYDSEKILKGLDLTFSQFLDVSIICGTDYCPEGIKGLGPVKGLKSIKKHGKLEDIGVPILFDLERVRELFVSEICEEDVKLTTRNFTWGSVDKEALDENEEIFANAIKLEKYIQRNSKVDNGEDNTDRTTTESDNEQYEEYLVDSSSNSGSKNGKIFV